MKTTDNRRFTKTTQGSGTYKCDCCGKLTRETGSEESSCHLCKKCFDEINEENKISDGKK